MLVIASALLVGCVSDDDQSALAPTPDASLLQASFKQSPAIAAPWEAIYMVAPEEQAVWARWELNHANSMREVAGATIVRHAVVAVPSRLIEDFVRSIHADANLALLGAGLPAMTLTDLRRVYGN